MRLKVCVLARENVLHWASHYIAAFRRACDVIAVGPGLDIAALRALGREHLASTATPNDIITSSDSLPEALALLPDGWSPDLIVGIQSSGPAYRDVARVRRPTVYLSIDTWHDMQEFATARAYDFTFTAQRVFVPWFHDAGAPRCFWSPLACDSAAHHPTDAAADHDIAFVGTTKFVVNLPRIARIERLRQHFRVLHEEDVAGEAYCRALCRGRLAFNSSIAQDVNMRVFEALAVGRPLLMNRDAAVNGLFDLFEDGKHLITYDDDDLIAVARRYLGDARGCEAVAQAGLEEVLAKHTYDHRVAAILDTVRAHAPHLGEQTAVPLLRAGPGASAFLPNAPGAVLDIGLALDASKVALRRRGVTRLVGVSDDADALRRRANSYDETASWPIAAGCQDVFDTVCWTVPFHYVGDSGALLRHAWELLAIGGTLVLRLSPDEVDQSGLGLDETGWRKWLEEHSFHVVLFDAPANGNPWCTLLARRSARPVSEIAAEVYARFPVPAAPQ